MLDWGNCKEIWTEALLPFIWQNVAAQAESTTLTTTTHTSKQHPEKPKLAADATKDGFNSPLPQHLHWAPQDWLHILRVGDSSYAYRSPTYDGKVHLEFGLMNDFIRWDISSSKSVCSLDPCLDESCKTRVGFFWHSS